MARRKKLNEDQPSPENKENADDTFGLPEIEYEPLKREETPQTEPVSEPASYVEEERVVEEENTVYEHEEVQREYRPSYEEEEETSSPWPKIIGILVVLLLVGAGAYWFFGVYRPGKAAEEKARQEQVAREEAERKALEDRLAEDRRIAEQRAADSLANLQQPKEGSIETLSERTGRYYVVVASAIDGDLIMDYAKKLSPNGVNAKIIPPFGKTKFYRLAVAEGDTYADTQTIADGLKGDEYGQSLWVVRY